MITRAAFCGVKRWSVLLSRMVGKDVIGISFVDLEFSGADQRDAAEGRRPSHREVETTDLVSNAASTVAHAPGSTRCRARRPTQRTTDLPMNSGLECRERNELEYAHSCRDRPLEFKGRPFFGPDFRSLSDASAGRNRGYHLLGRSSWNRVATLMDKTLEGLEVDASTPDIERRRREGNLKIVRAISAFEGV